MAHRGEKVVREDGECRDRAGVALQAVGDLI